MLFQRALIRFLKLLIIVCGGFYILAWIFHLSDNAPSPYPNYLQPQDMNSEGPSTKTFFVPTPNGPANEEEFQQRENGSREAGRTEKFIVDQKHCRIPEVTLWTDEERWKNSVYEPPECLKGVDGAFPGLTFVRKNNLLINDTLKKSLGFRHGDLDCCYQEIQHPPLQRNNWEMFVKKKVSENCIPFKGGVITPKFNSLEVTCFAYSWNEKPLEIHRDFHILANVQSKDVKVRRKRRYWARKEDLPPSVFILGLDCGNRLSFRRQMPSTVKFLQNLGATEMLGYTKIASKTGSNLQSILTSFTELEMEKTCKYKSKPFVDKCPWLFYNYSDANYVTSFLENGNSFKEGRDAFLKQPTDFYPVVWARYAQGQLSRKTNVCMENKTIHQVMIDFNENFVRNMYSLRLPYFSLTWLDHLSQDNFNECRYIDKYLMESLQRLKNSGHLENTLLILTGQTNYWWYGERKSVPAWYEKKQPALWLKLPPKLEMKHPEMKEALGFNADKLSSSVDLHQTLQHVLSLGSGKKLKKSRVGSSLLKKLTDRNCSAAGIPPGFCPCSVLLPFHNIQGSFLLKAANAALQVPNFPLNSLPKNMTCRKLGVDRILAAAVVISDGHQHNLTDNQLEALITAGKHGLLLALATSVFKELHITEFVLKYDPKSPSQFKSFAVDSTADVALLSSMGYHRCQNHLLDAQYY